MAGAALMIVVSWRLVWLGLAVGTVYAAVSEVRADRRARLARARSEAHWAKLDAERAAHEVEMAARREEWVAEEAAEKAQREREQRDLIEQVLAAARRPVEDWDGGPV